MKHCLPLAALAFAGCLSLPSVGPDYSGVDIDVPDYALPDAGFPTTNTTAVGEWRPADSNADYRVSVTTNEIRRWWTRFDDAVLTNLVTSAVSNNISSVPCRA